MHARRLTMNIEQQLHLTQYLAVSNGMRQLKLCSNKILQLITGSAG